MFYYKTIEDKDGLWLSEKDNNWKFTNKTESVFSSENGYLGIRAAQDFKGIGQSRGMFVTGLYQKASDSEVTELVNCPDVTETDIIIDDERLSLDTLKIHNYSRKYNVYTGEVVTEFKCELKSGLQVQIRSRRFASISDRHLFCQQIELSPINKDAKDVQITSGINGQITNSGAAHFRDTECLVYDKKIMHYKGKTDDNELDILFATRYENVGGERKANFVLKRRSIFEKCSFDIAKNETTTLTKYAYICSSVDKDNAGVEAATDKVKNLLDSEYSNLYEMHKKSTEKFWETASLQIEGISLEEKSAIAYCQYQLFGMTPYDTDNSSIAAKGLSGEGYKGHVFWDTEIYMLPFYYYTFPETARNLLMYRYKRLNGAYEKAREYGYEGAMFPWESAADGSEETPKYAALNIHTGKANKVWSGIKEHHVTADIAFAIINYYGITKDVEFMHKYGLEMLIETSRFWVSRAEKKNGRYEILDIIGPDEYNEHINNNAFTNYMVKYCLYTTAELLENMKKDYPDIYIELDRKTSLSQLIPQLMDVVENIYLPQPDEDGIIPMDDEFMGKPELPDIEKYKKSLIKQSVLLDYSRDEVVNMRTLKQADTVMLLNLFPTLFSPEIVKKNVKFYEERTLHDSSLSYCAHAQACANIGEIDMATGFFEKALEIDLDDNPYDSTDGLHSASMGGVWNVIVGGFVGLSHSLDEIKIEPHLPNNWTSITLNIIVNGVKVRATVNEDKVKLVSEKAMKQPVNLNIFGKKCELINEIEVAK